MTGNALMGDREKCLEAGMDDYISKPIRIGDLQQALERWAPAHRKKSDTAFLSRNKFLTVEQLLDPEVISELRAMPPSDEGVTMLRELVDLFLETAPKRLEQINAAADNPEQLAFHAHAMKSMSLNLGAKRMVELARALEDLGRESKLTDVAPLIKELDSAFVHTKAHLLPLRDT